MSNLFHSLILIVYQRSSDILDRFYGLLRCLFDGFWLGLFSHEMLHRIDKHYYDTTDAYHSAAYNRRGLWPWEQAMLDRYFQGRGSLLVIGAGGGREPLALYKLGYRVDSYECNPKLVDLANRLLIEDGAPGRVQLIQRDTCPPTTMRYDGVIIGWGAYMLIRGRDRRIAFLRSVRALVEEDAPVLLSFFTRPGDLAHFKLITYTANILRWLLRNERVEIGDALAPNFVHYFTQAEIASELHAAGFKLAYYGERGYGHAVGIAHARASAGRGTLYREDRHEIRGE